MTSTPRHLDRPVRTCTFSGFASTAMTSPSGPDNRRGEERHDADVGAHVETDVARTEMIAHRLPHRVPRSAVAVDDRAEVGSPAGTSSSYPPRSTRRSSADPSASIRSWNSSDRRKSVIISGNGNPARTRSRKCSRPTGSGARRRIEPIRVIDVRFGGSIAGGRPFSNRASQLIPSKYKPHRIVSAEAGHRICSSIASTSTTTARGRLLAMRWSLPETMRHDPRTDRCARR